MEPSPDTTSPAPDLASPTTAARPSGTAQLANTCTVTVELTSGPDDLRDNSRFRIALRSWDGSRWTTYGLVAPERRLRPMTVSGPSEWLGLPNGIAANSTTFTPPLAVPVLQTCPFDQVNGAAVELDGRHGDTFQDQDNWDLAGIRVISLPDRRVFYDQRDLRPCTPQENNRPRLTGTHPLWAGKEDGCWTWQNRLEGW